LSEMLRFGIGLGCAMYLGKFLLVWFASRSFGWTKRLFKWIHHQPLALLIMDVGFNWTASKLIASAPGLTTITALATFQIISIMYCITVLYTGKATKLVRRYM